MYREKKNPMRNIYQVAGVTYTMQTVKDESNYITDTWHNLTEKGGEKKGADFGTKFGKSCFSLHFKDKNKRHRP